MHSRQEANSGVLKHACTHARARTHTHTHTHANKQTNKQTQTQELKGNIRVFCRVRPMVGSETSRGEPESQALAVEFPETSDILSAGITLQVWHGWKCVSHHVVHGITLQVWHCLAWLEVCWVCTV